MGEGGSGHWCAMSGSKVTGPAGEPGVQEGTYRGAMDWGTRTGLSTAWGSRGTATRRPQKSIQVARLLRPVPRSSEYHFSTFCQSSLDSGQEGLLSEDIQNAKALASRLQWPHCSSGDVPLLTWQLSRALRRQPSLHPHLTSQGGGSGHSVGRC